MDKVDGVSIVSDLFDPQKVRKKIGQIDRTSRNCEYLSMTQKQIGQTERSFDPESQTKKRLEFHMKVELKMCIKRSDKILPKDQHCEKFGRKV